MSVFLSYAREDRPYAQKLARHLSDNRINVWWDHDLIVGARYEEETEAKLDTASAVIVLLTPHSVASQWVRDEVKFAIDEGKCVYPLLLEECKLPLRWRSLQHEDVTGWDMPSDEFIGRLSASPTDALRAEIEKLRTFERDNRSRLKSYYTEQVEKLIAIDGTTGVLTEFFEEYVERTASFFRKQIDALDSPSIDALVRATYDDKEDKKLRSFVEQYQRRLQEFYNTELNEATEARAGFKDTDLKAPNRQTLAATFNNKLDALGAPPVPIPWV